MNTWIFQCNPDRFDVDAYLVFCPRRITWQVNQSWNQIREGDQVFLWRARGNGTHGAPGIIAECRVASQVTFMTDEPEGRPFWRAPDGADQSRRRVWLSVTRVAAKDAVMRRDVLEQDPALAGMGPMAFGNATNFVVEPERVGRLNFKVGSKSSYHIQPKTFRAIWTVRLPNWRNYRCPLCLKHMQSVEQATQAASRAHQKRQRGFLSAIHMSERLRANEQGLRVKYRAAGALRL